MKKTTVIIISVLAAVFAVINILWAVIMLPIYKPYKETIGYDEQRKSWYKRENDYVYSVSPPSYLSFSGNISVTEVMKIDKNGKALAPTNCSLIIWIEPNNKFEFGFSIGINDEKEQAYINNDYMLNEKMEPVENISKEDEKIIAENFDKIKEMYGLAKKMWHDLPISEENISDV